MRKLILIGFCLAFVIAGCNSGNEDHQNTQAKNKKLFTRMPADSTNIRFVNKLTETDIINPLNDQYVYNGSGVAVGDLNNDGLPDVFFAANMESSKLYLNKGNFKFEDITEKAGLTTKSWCSGVTMADVNADGFLDIYVSCGGKFTEAEGRANLLFINNGNLTFIEQAKAYGIDDKGYSGQSTFFDYDRDGDLDLFVMNQPVEINFKIDDMAIHNKKITPYTSSHFYRNTGHNKFEDVSKEAGIESNAFSLSCTVGDINEDGWPDLFVTNDYMMSDFAYINNKNGGFTEENKQRFQHNCYFSMGSDLGDFNNDGYVDIIQCDMLPEDNYRQKLLLGPNNYDRYYFMISKGYGHQYMQNCLQLNNGNGTFSDIAAFAGVEKTDWSWASLFADFDNDGWKDIFIDNGYLRDFTNLDYIMYRSALMQKNNGKIPDPLQVVYSMSSTPLKSYVYKNNRDLTFTNMADEWGLDAKSFANGAAYADFDNDGDLDLVINNLNVEAITYKNNAEARPGNNFLSFNFKGKAPNNFGTGTTVSVYSADNKQMAQAIPTRGFYSAVDARLHFGLSDNTIADSIVIQWPDGSIQRLYQVKANRFLTVSQADAVLPQSIGSGLPKDKNQLFTEMKEVTSQLFVHKENEFLDFKREPLLPQLYSRMGPALANGDIDHNGLDDFYAGGAKGQSGCLYRQTKGGIFERLDQQAFHADMDQEDVNALFFDADNDGDQDLYVVSGGSEITGTSSWYQDRLYLNNGKGNFQRAKDNLPEISSSGYCVASADYDGDGDLDLFRGGRISPGNYPFHPQSYLLQNNKGRFTDVTDKLASGLTYTGMVTAACWIDYNQDKTLDLVVTGEWMPIKIFQQRNGKFTEVTNEAGLNYTNGWWNSLASADFDGDGDMDLIAGNFGTNSRIKTVAHNPACVYAKDFDANGSTDAIICHLFADSIVYPMYSRDELIDQIRSLRKKLPDYAGYAGKTIEQIFSAEELKSAFVEKAYTFLSSYFENNGDGTYTMKPLPNQVNISTINTIICNDFDHDGKMDALLGGNNYSLTPAEGRMDAGTGLMLKGNGKGVFLPVNSNESGFFAGKDVKSMVLLNTAMNQKIIVVGNNNDKLQFFRSK